MSIKIEKLDNFGRGIGYLDKIVFVNNALPNEEVDINVKKETSKYINASVKEYKKISNSRIKPKCPYYNLCGGCNLMHLNYDDQIDYKINNIIDLFKKNFNYTDIKLVQSNKDLFYRNKVSLKVINYEYGYYEDDSHNFIKIDNCLLASSSINDFIKNKYINIKNGDLIIRSNYQNEILIAINSNDEVTFNKLPENVVGIVLNNNVIYKNDYFYDMIDNFKFKISYNSFFQINNFIASEIFKILNNNLSGKSLLDLYCGVGTLGLSLKEKYNEIYGIEIVENAIKNAKENALINNANNFHFYCGDAGKILNKLNIKFDTVLVDPPRSGLNEETLKNILKVNPEKIGYVSCNPITLIRDLKILLNYYNIKKINIFDMFPNTYHVECVVLLERRKAL